MILDRPFVFIVGAPRSGTTWLQAMVGAHPAICTTDELKLFDFFTGPWAKSWDRLLLLQKDGGDTRRHGLTGVWTEDEFYGFLREFLERVYARVLERKPEAKVILDKTPGYSEYVEHINWLVPQARFIHVIRDGRDVAVSLQAASQGWARTWAPRKAESAAALWKSTLLAARKGARYQDRYLEVRYEDLLRNGPSLLASIFDFIGVSVDPGEAAAIFEQYQFQKMKGAQSGARGLGLPADFLRKGQAGDWRTALQPKQRYVFHEAAGDLLCELGYSSDSWWADHWYHRFTLPLMAMFHNPRKARQKALQALRRGLGPVWTQRMREARTSLRRRDTGNGNYKSGGRPATP